MCTVTYIPGGDNQFILTSNRDEYPERSTSLFGLTNIGKDRVLYPVDPVSQGSWIAASATGKVACILNGAFERHQRNPPYRRSRGLLLLDFFESTTSTNFIRDYDFTGIEAFTLVAFEWARLNVFSWDGTHMHRQQLDSRIPHIWSSSTLYTGDIREKRKNWFSQWIEQNRHPEVADVLKFHRFGFGQQTDNSLVAKGSEQVQTLSITAIDRHHDFSGLHHFDLLKNQVTERHINFYSNEIMESG